MLREKLKKVNTMKRSKKKGLWLPKPLQLPKFPFFNFRDLIL
jgi:hypothetical protein